MPVLKETTVLFDNSLTAGGGPTTSGTETALTGWHKSIFVSFTNGATPPGTPASATIQGSPDNSEWYDIWPNLNGSTSSNGTATYERLVFAAVEYVRVILTHGNTGDPIDATVWASEVLETEFPPPNINYGAIDVGTSPIQLTISNIVVYEGVVVKAVNANTGTVYVGDDNVDETTGFELGAGESLTVVVDDVSKLWCVADAASQEVRWISS